MRVPAPGVKIGNSTRSNNKEERNLMDFMEIPDQVKKKNQENLYRVWWETVLRARERFHLLENPTGLT